MSKLLIAERPLVVLPSLAKALGNVDKAIILQQIQYWINRSDHVHDGYRWVYNTVASWHEQFPWLSEKTVQRYLKDLEDKGILISGNYNRYKFDRTKWYRIDYDVVDNLTERKGLAVPMEKDSQSPRKGTANPQGKGPAGVTNTIDYSESTTEITSGDTPLPPKGGGASAKPDAHSVDQEIEQEFERLWKKYPNKKGKKAALRHYKAWRKASPQHTEEYIARQLDAYIAYLKAPENSWRRPQDGSTWFNGRFDDDWSLQRSAKQPTTREDYLNGFGGRRFK